MQKTFDYNLHTAFEVYSFNIFRKVDKAKKFAKTMSDIYLTILIIASMNTV